MVARLNATLTDVQSDTDSAGEGASPDSVPPDPGLDENLPALLREALKQPGVSSEMARMTIAAFSASSHSGPLPPAEQIRAYEDVLPGSADRLFSMAERQQAHRQELETMTVREAANRSWWGLRLGFAISVLVIAVGAAAILTGRSTAGLSVIIANVVVLAGVFVYGRSEQRKERVEKDRQTRPSAPSP
jgi:uncharacterized membrane protein